LYLKQDILIQIDILENKLKDLIFKLSESLYINDETFNEMIDLLVNSIEKIQLINNINADFYVEKISDNIVNSN
jgi:hypothetical protein